MKYFAILISFFFRSFKRVLMHVYTYRFKKSKRVIFNPFDYFSYKNIILGEDVFIGPGANFSASNVNIIIGNKVMFGPNVAIMAGNHNYSVPGVYMKDVENKEFDDDKEVKIDDDVWIGANVTILKGVHIGQGAIVAAGSLVNKNVESFTIVAGVPAKFIKRRFKDKENQDLHEFFLNKKLR